jgi:hypothetical protein
LNPDLAIEISIANNTDSKRSLAIPALEIAKKWNGVAPQSVVVTQGGANILLPLK